MNGESVNSLHTLRHRVSSNVLMLLPIVNSVPDQFLNNVWRVCFQAAALIQPKSELYDVRGSAYGRALSLFLISYSDLISTYSLYV
jgi:hypothetical protein